MSINKVHVFIMKVISGVSCWLPNNCSKTLWCDPLIWFAFHISEYHISTFNLRTVYKDTHDQTMTPIIMDLGALHPMHPNSESLPAEFAPDSPCGFCRYLFWHTWLRNVVRINALIGWITLYGNESDYTVAPFRRKTLQWKLSTV